MKSGNTPCMGKQSRPILGDVFELKLQPTTVAMSSTVVYSGSLWELPYQYNRYLTGLNKPKKRHP
jgi:hypothetical protein